jgi:hypothetical protein
MKSYGPSTCLFVLALFFSVILGAGCSSTKSDQIEPAFLLRPEVHQQYAELYKAQSANLENVATYWFALKNANQLPGVSKDDHGQFSAYYLSSEMQSEWLHSKILSKEMISDIANCQGSSYLDFVSPKVEGRDPAYLYYFFCMQADGTIQLMSTYQNVGGRWSKMK